MSFVILTGMEVLALHPVTTGSSTITVQAVAHPTMGMAATMEVTVVMVVTWAEVVARTGGTVHTETGPKKLSTDCGPFSEICFCVFGFC